MSHAKIMLDTSVVSFLMRGDALAKAYAVHVQGKLASISFITVGEMYYGAEKANWGNEKRAKLETALRNFVVVPYDHAIARKYGEIAALMKRKGKPIPFSDAWIAACAVRHNVPLATHDPSHFAQIPDLNIVTEK